VKCKAILITALHRSDTNPWMSNENQRRLFKVVTLWEKSCPILNIWSICSHSEGTTTTFSLSIQHYPMAPFGLAGLEQTPATLVFQTTLISEYFWYTFSGFPKCNFFRYWEFRSIACMSRRYTGNRSSWEIPHQVGLSPGFWEWLSIRGCIMTKSR
jgi:hypothetical protein